MSEVAMTIRENRRAFRKDYGLENALAKYVRNRWMDKTIPHAAHHFGLSESEAAKVVYGSASKNTLRKLLHHPHGGASLFVELVFDVTETNLAQYITDQARKAANEAERWQAEERRLALLHSRVSVRHSLGGGSDQPPRSGRAGDASLGADPDGRAVKPKSLAPPNDGGRS